MTGSDCAPTPKSTHRFAMRSGSRYDGSGRSSTPLTTVKIVVVAPMPSPSVRIATAAKPGLRRSVRQA
jgi:hypothetical protein